MRGHPPWWCARSRSHSSSRTSIRIAFRIRHIARLAICTASRPHLGSQIPRPGSERRRDALRTVRHPPLRPRRRRPPARLGPHRAHAGAPRRRAPADAARRSRLGSRARSADRAGRRCRWCAGGLESIYLSGWQVAADANLAAGTYPDQSLYPANSGPALARRINSALLRADQISHAEGDDSIHWLAPIVADAEAGFGGPLNAFEIMKAYIEAGAAGVHFEDQLSSEKKCGHLGGKVLVPTSQFVRTLVAARLAADVAGVPTVIVARTDALSASPPDQRRRRDRPRLLHRRADERGVLPRARRDRRGDRARPRVRALRRPDLVRDLDARPGRGGEVRCRDPRAAPRPAARLQLLTVVQLAAEPDGRPDRGRSSAISPRWATASSSSRSPGSTPSTSRCTSSPAGTVRRR